MDLKKKKKGANLNNLKFETRDVSLSFMSTTNNESLQNKTKII